MKYGNIPLDVLLITMYTIDDDELVLRELLEEYVDEDIIEAKFLVGLDEYDNQQLETFNAWTKNYVIVLQNTPIGCYLGVYDRNPS